MASGVREAFELEREYQRDTGVENVSRVDGYDYFRQSHSGRRKALLKCAVSLKKKDVLPLIQKTEQSKTAYIIYRMNGQSRTGLPTFRLFFSLSPALPLQHNSK